MKNKMEYSKDFYNNRTASLKSAKVIVPIVIDLINPRSVIDIGCGNGSFLKVFKDNSVKDVLGVDGPWIKKEQLLISEKEFLEENLEKFVPTGKNFNLAISLEVAEHLSKGTARQFIKNITSESDMVLFSAAIPLQGGVNHINEQWQTYWVNIFKNYGYVPIDCFRNKLWNNDDVSFWFAQNMFLFVKRSRLEKEPKLKKIFSKNGKVPLNIVHPKLFSPKAQRYHQISSIIPQKIKRILRRVIP